MFLKPRQTGRVYAFCTDVIIQMRHESKTELRLGLIMLKDSTDNLAQYLSIFDSFGATTSYKLMQNEDKFLGYQLTIKLKKDVQTL